MGQAKARGSFENRKIESVARFNLELEAREKALYDEEMALTPDERIKRKQAQVKTRSLLAMMAGMGHL